MSFREILISSVYLISAQATFARDPTHDLNHLDKKWGQVQDSIFSLALPLPELACQEPATEQRAFPSGAAWTELVMHEVKPYFLSPYRDSRWNAIERKIKGKVYRVERFNHALAHGLRQGAQALDAFELLVQAKKRNVVFQDANADGIMNWAAGKMAGERRDPLFMRKLEMVAAFQQTGMQSEVSSSSDPVKFMAYQMQDSENFKKSAKRTGLFSSEEEINLFSAAILRSKEREKENEKGEDENILEEINYIRRILHTAHIFDLRRIPSPGGERVGARIRQDGIDELLGGVKLPMTGERGRIARTLWERSGQYLRSTGDRDLDTGRIKCSDDFFLQTYNPKGMVAAIHAVRGTSISSGRGNEE